MINFDDEFLRAFSEVAEYQLPAEAIDELMLYKPEFYSTLTKKDYNKPEISQQAVRDYLSIVKSYLIFYRIPITLESLTSAYEWGITNLKEKGLEKSPVRVKRYITKIKFKLQATQQMLEAEYINKG